MAQHNKRTKRINEITLIGSMINLLLAAGKTFAGFAGKSSAMIADGIHSLSDLVTDIIVIVFVSVSGKDRDDDHQYGHGKFETFATMLISFILMIVGLGILWTGVQKVMLSINGGLIEQPKLIALFAALVSILFKEGLYWYTKISGQNLKSQALIANAWHHRSDALSSIGTALGISGAIFLGDKWRILDPIAGIIVSFFILKVSWDIAKPSINELLEGSLPAHTESDISQIISKTVGVKGFHNLRTRKIGDIIGIDVHIKVDKQLSVESSHQIATEIENSLKESYGTRSHIGIHVEPFYEKKVRK